MQFRCQSPPLDLLRLAQAARHVLQALCQIQCRLLRQPALPDLGLQGLVGCAQFGGAFAHTPLQILVEPADFLLRPPALGDVLAQGEETGDCACGIAVRNIAQPARAHLPVVTDLGHLELDRLAGQSPQYIRLDLGVDSLADELAQGQTHVVAAVALAVDAVGESHALRLVPMRDSDRKRVEQLAQMRFVAPQRFAGLLRFADVHDHAD